MVLHEFDASRTPYNSSSRILLMNNQVRAPRNAKATIEKLAHWLEPREKELSHFVDWDRLQPSAAESWLALISYVRESHAFLSETGADWLLLVAAAEVLGPVVVLHEGTSRAVRFVSYDTAHAAGKQEFERTARLPAASEAWIRLGLLRGGHFVHCRTKTLKCEVLRRMLDEKDRELDASLRRAGYLESIALDGLRRQVLSLPCQLMLVAVAFHDPSGLTSVDGSGWAS